MASKKKGSKKQGDGDNANMVPVVFARNEEEALEYQELLGDHDIPSTFTMSNITNADAEDAEEEDLRSRMSRGIPVMVPEAMLDEASEIIADREDTEEFALDDEDFEDEDDDYEYDEGFDGTLDDVLDDDEDDDL